MKEYIRTSHSTGKDKGLHATNSGIILGTIWISNILHSEDADKDIQFSLADELSHYLYEYNSAIKGYSNTYRTDEVEISDEGTEEAENVKNQKSDLFLNRVYWWHDVNMLL